MYENIGDLVSKMLIRDSDVVLFCRVELNNFINFGTIFFTEFVVRPNFFVPFNITDSTQLLNPVNTDHKEVIHECPY